MGRLDLPDVHRHEDADYGRGRSRRIEKWKRLREDGLADKACDLLLAYETETPPLRLLQAIAAAPVVAERDIDRLDGRWPPSQTMKPHPPHRVVRGRKRHCRGEHDKSDPSLRRGLIN